MRYPRAGVVIAVASVLLAAGASTASACNEPNAKSPTGGPQTAGPDDPVGFVIPTAEPGADIKVTVEGHTFNFEASNYGYQGSFPMPDIGEQARTVYPDVVATHEEHGGQPTRSSLTVHYTGHPTPLRVPGRPHPRTTPPGCRTRWVNRRRRTAFRRMALQRTARSRLPPDPAVTGCRRFPAATRRAARSHPVWGTSPLQPRR